MQGKLEPTFISISTNRHLQLLIQQDPRVMEKFNFYKLSSIFAVYHKINENFNKSMTFYLYWLVIESDTVLMVLHLWIILTAIL